MSKFNMWVSGFCSFGALIQFLIFGNIGWGCCLAILAIGNLVVGEIM